MNSIMANTLTILILASLTLYATAQITFRLPNGVVPVHYQLTVETDLPTFTFGGTVIINVNFLQVVDTIVLHSRDLLLSGLSVTYNSTNIFSHFDLVPATDFLRIFLNRSVTVATSASISINFNGTLGTQNVGFYRASYVNELNQVRFLAITHLEATNARRAFPCFDQPNFKATFQINLIRNNQLITASNALLMYQAIEPGNRMRDIYSTTPAMSTYLVAFMVSDYVFNHTLFNGVNYRTFGRAEHIGRGDGLYSITVAQQAIARMQEITNVNYTLNTMDQVAVPNEFYKIGAMENWGMVTYREKYLMFNALTTTAAEQQFITTIISHELAHQWFGNLVTPDWWRYIWLNEGFATYFEMIVTAANQPTWQMNAQFITTMMQRALDDDAVLETRPMTRNAESPEEIDAQYDSIVYEKAGSVIRMVANFMGETPFRNGLTLYLNNFALRNVVPLNLYASWQTFAPGGLNINNIMTPWEMQAGYPVVTVTRIGNNTWIQQERFFINLPTTDDSIWPIPLNWLTINGPVNTITWFNMRNSTVNLNIVPQAWVIFNVQQTGFYRVNYDANNWLLIRNYLWTGDFPAIPVINRAQLIDDAFNLARSGRLRLSIAMDIGSYIRNETEFVPITTFTRAFAHLDRLFTGTRLHESIRRYAVNALEPTFNRTGFILQTDDHLTKLTKVQVLTWLCHVNQVQCRTHSRQQFTNWITQNAVIQADSQNFVFCNGIRDGTVGEWNIALQRYTALREATQRTRIAQGLGCSSSDVELRRLLDLVIEVNSVFSQSDRLPAVTSVYTNNGVRGVNVVLQWLTTNFTVINQRVGNVVSIVKGVANRITTAEQAQLFNQFVTQNGNSFTPAMITATSSSMIAFNANMQWATTTATEVDLHFAGTATGVYCQILLLLSCILISMFYV